MAPTLPFEPESVIIDDLPDALAKISSEPVVHELQKADTRKGAAAVYERRVDEIRASQLDVTDEDRKRGYRVTSWHDYPNYECLNCPFASLSEEQTTAHVANH